MKKEEPPYNLKLHIFLKKDRPDGTSDRDLRLTVMDKLNSFKAEKIKDHPTKDDKIPFLFEINDLESAVSCYKYFNTHNERLKNGDTEFITETARIYYQKDEAILEMYADQEAAIYA